MAGRQRELEREYKREQKDRRNKLIIWIILAVIFLALVIMKVCEININTIKDRFTDEDGKFTLTDGVVTDNYPYSIDSSSNVTLVNTNNKIGILTPNSYTVLDSTNASSSLFFEHGYSNPRMANAGAYSLIYDQGANKYRLDNTSQNEYEEETDNSILCADVSKNGTVALATTSTAKLCDLLVFSRSLEKKFELSISDGFVVDIALSDNSTQVSVAVVNSKNAEFITTVYTYDVNSDGSKPRVVSLPSGTLADIKCAGSNVWVVADTYVGVINKNGEYKNCFESGAINTKCFNYTPSGDLVIAFGDYNNSAENTIACIKSNSNIRCSVKIDNNVECICATSSLITALTTDEIISYNVKNGEEKERIAVNEAVKSVLRLGNNTYIHRQSVIDRLTQEKK